MVMVVISVMVDVVIPDLRHLSVSGSETFELDYGGARKQHPTVAYYTCVRIQLLAGQCCP